MAKYRKKPVEIDAWQFTGQFRHEWPDWLKGHPTTAFHFDRGQDVEPMSLAEISIETLEGVMTAKLGDWIIQGVKGEVYPCKPDIFEATYDPVPTDQKG